MTKSLDEVELGTLIALVIRAAKARWKWMLFVFVCINVGAIIVVSAATPIYQVWAIIEPGVVGIKTNGQFVFSDTSINIAERLSKGEFNDYIFNDLKLPPENRFQDRFLRHHSL